ncbi:rod shape-determining protein RodA [Candidatus Berkelbacteria bacterium]|nr:rod shape-determining protein RodA [Candidatus Berkelbacteria bacterium]
MVIKLPKPIDWTLYLVAVALTGLGVAVLSSIELTLRTQLISNQFIFITIGLVFMVLLTFLDYRTFRALAYYLYGLLLLAFVLVIFFGTKVLGATRWIDVGLFQFQPSELFKPIFIMTLARYLSESATQHIRLGLAIVFLTIIPVGLVMKQPDLGTAGILLLIALVMISLKGLPRRVWLVGGIIVLLAAPLLFTHLKPYQKDRLRTFLNPAADPLGVGYNINQSLIAIGSGGIYGRGLGQGSQSQLQFLPVAHTDFIFAGVAEATGFIGSILLIALLVFLVLRVLNVARVSQDEFGYYFAFGIAVLYFAQASINIGVNLGLLPATGVPLPLVSYGGTQTITSFATIGILQSIYLRHKKIRFTA